MRIFRKRVAINFRASRAHDISALTPPSTTPVRFSSVPDTTAFSSASNTLPLLNAALLPQWLSDVPYGALSDHNIGEGVKSALGSFVVFLQSSAPCELSFSAPPLSPSSLKQADLTDEVLTPGTVSCTGWDSEANEIGTAFNLFPIITSLPIHTFGTILNAMP